MQPQPQSTSAAHQSKATSRRLFKSTMMNGIHSLHHHHHHHQQQHISPKTKSIRANSQQWKDNLRNQCLKRAKDARRDLLLKRRRERGRDRHEMLQESHNTGSIGYEIQREVIDAYNQEMTLDHPDDEDSMHLVAKSLVEKEIQRSMLDLDHFHLQSRHLNDDSLDIDNSETKLVSCSEDTLESKQEYVELLSREGDEKETYKMTQVDYIELLHDVTQELERVGM
jgi:hypothetical protein